MVMEVMVEGLGSTSVVDKWKSDGPENHVSLVVITVMPGGARFDGSITIANEDGATIVYVILIGNGTSPLAGHAATNIIGNNFVDDPGGIREWCFLPGVYTRERTKQRYVIYRGAVVRLK